MITFTFSTYRQTSKCSSSTSYSTKLAKQCFRRLAPFISKLKGFVSLIGPMGFKPKLLHVSLTLHFIIASLTNGTIIGQKNSYASAP